MSQLSCRHRYIWFCQSEQALVEACLCHVLTRLLFPSVHGYSEGSVGYQLVSCIGRASASSWSAVREETSRSDQIRCTYVYMKAGTSKDPKFFPVHEIHRILSEDQLDTLLAFYALTECDSVSQFSGHGKKTAWQVFEQHHTDLAGLRKGSFTEDILTSSDVWHWFMQQSTSKAILQRSSPRDCHQPQMLWGSISCVHTIKQLYGIKLTCHGYSLCHLCPKPAGSSLMWVYKRVPLQLQVCMYNRLY